MTDKIVLTPMQAEPLVRVLLEIAAENDAREAAAEPAA